MNINEIIESNVHTELSWRVLLEKIDDLEDNELRSKFFEFIGYLNFEIKDIIENKDKQDEVALAANAVIADLLNEVEISSLITLPGIHRTEEGQLIVEEYSFTPQQVAEITPGQKITLRNADDMSVSKPEQTCRVRLNSGTLMRLIGSRQKITAYINKLR